MEQNGTPRNTETPSDNGISPQQTAYESVISRPHQWDEYGEDVQMAAAQFAWGLASQAEYNLPDGDCLDVLRRAWQTPRCRLWIQDQQSRYTYWNADTRRTWAELMESKPTNDYLGDVVADVPMVRPRWLLPPWIRVGKLHAFVGKPKVGKSSLSLWLAAKIMEQHPTGKIIIFTREDDIAEDIRPRCVAGRINEDRIVVYRHPITFADTDRLEAVVRHHDALMIVFDTIQRYPANPKTNWYNAYEVQRELNPLEQLAVKTDAAILLIQHAKRGASEALEAGIGSQGIAGACRSILVAGHHPDNKGEYALSLAGANHAASGGSLIYRLSPVPVQFSDGKEDIVYAEMLREDSELDADDITNTVSTARDIDSRDAPTPDEWLMETLADGPVPQKELQKLAKDDNVAWYAVRQASKRLGVWKGKEPSSRPYKERPYVWMLPSRSVEYSNQQQPKETRINTDEELVAVGCCDKDIRASQQPIISQDDTQVSKEEEAGIIEQIEARDWRKLPGADRAQYALWKWMEEVAEKQGIEPGIPEFIRRRDAVQRAMDGGVAITVADITPHAGDAAVG